ncbi:MAG: Swarming motility protein SwrB, partial [Bacillus sp. (in: firmicutes)]
MTFVLIISFILHAFSMFAMIILYLRQNQYKQAEQAMEKLQKDVEAVLQSFLMEIQEENKQLAE